MPLTEGDGERNDTNGEPEHTNGCRVSESRTEITRNLSLGRDEQPLVELWCQSHGFGELITKLLFGVEVRVVGGDGVVILRSHCEW